MQAKTKILVERLVKIGATLSAISAIIGLIDQIYKTWDPKELPSGKD